MAINIIQFILFLLFFVPGYLFIHTMDYFLLKGIKSQFEKTIQLLMSSAVIWLTVIILSKFTFVSNEIYTMKVIIINAIFNNNNINDVYKKLLVNDKSIARLYIYICIISFISGVILGLIRKNNIIDRIIKEITGRDRFISVSIRFYTEQLGSTIAVTMKDGHKYIGVLIGAPDTTNDNNIIISYPIAIEKDRQIGLISRQMLIKLDDVSRIELVNLKQRRDVWQTMKTTIVSLWVKAKISVLTFFKKA